MKTKTKNIAAKAVSIGMAAMMTGSMITPTFAASYKWPLGNYRGKITRKFGKMDILERIFQVVELTKERFILSRVEG